MKKGRLLGLLVIVSTLVLTTPLTSVYAQIDTVYNHSDYDLYIYNYEGSDTFYNVPNILEKTENNSPKNIILFIGDGMGVSHITAAYIANGGNLFLNNFKNIGLTTTYSATDFITDSGAAATALATGEKTFKYSIGMNADTIPVKNIREIYQEAGKLTGIVVTATVTHATPAAFVAHREHRNQHEDIALDYYNSDIDLFIGGGYRYFANRSDGIDLIEKLISKGYHIITEADSLKDTHWEKVAGLIADKHPNSSSNWYQGFLSDATKFAIENLSNENGFFLMVEGSQIDWGGHNNDISYIIREMLEFDKAIGEALIFASENNETLVLVVSDHETGGLAIEDGDLTTGRVKASFASTNHTGSIVPVFAFGAGAKEFKGIYHISDIPKKLIKLKK